MAFIIEIPDEVPVKAPPPARQPYTASPNRTQPPTTTAASPTTTTAQIPTSTAGPTASPMSTTTTSTATNTSAADATAMNAVVVAGSSPPEPLINKPDKLPTGDEVNKLVAKHIVGNISALKVEAAVPAVARAWESLKEYDTIIIVDDGNKMDDKALVDAERAVCYLVHYAQAYKAAVSLRFFNHKDGDDIEIKDMQSVRDAFSDMRSSRPSPSNGPSSRILLGRAIEKTLTSYMTTIKNTQIAREDGFFTFVHQGLDYEPKSSGKKTIRDKVIALGLKDLVTNNKSDVRKAVNEKERLALKDGVALLCSHPAPNSVLGFERTVGDKTRKELADLGEKYPYLKVVGQPIRRASFVVVTCGVDPLGQSRARESIRETSDDLLAWRFPKNQVGMQLVQIGHNPEAVAFLKLLDDGIENKKRILGGKVVSDLIDTISYDLQADSATMTPERVALFVYHALLGAINPTVDQRASLVKTGRLAGFLHR